MSVLSIFKRKGLSGFGYGSTAEDITGDIDLKGQTILVTGTSSGLGLETVLVLARRGAKIIATGRTADTVRAACSSFSPTLISLACELSDPASVRACVATVKKSGEPLNALICNAGIMALPTLQQACGYELQFFTNHIGHFMLVTGLLDRLSENGRVVLVSSDAHRAAPKNGIEFDNLSGARSYRPWAMYAQSKLANLLFARELARRLKSKKQTANAIHPGVIKTNLGRSMNPVIQFALAVAEPLVLKTVAQGAATQCYVGVHPGASGVSGEYFADCNVAEGSPISRDASLASRLWEESERIAMAV